MSTPPTMHPALRQALELHQSGQLAQAEEAFQRILEIAPQHALAIEQLGVIALQTGRASQAVDFIRRAIAIDGQIADWHVNLGAAYNALNRPEDAVRAFQQAIAIDPQSAVAHSNLAAVVKDIDLEQAIAIGRRAIELRADPVAHSNLLLSLNYSLTDSMQLLAEHREWARRYADVEGARGKGQGTSEEAFSLAPRPSPLAPGSRIRIGYISADFRDHAMAHFLLPLLTAHDRTQFDVVGFDDTRRPDAVTEKFRSLSTRWVRTAGLGPEQVAEVVRAERIDILVDLAGHFAGNRLLVFARRPAPVQVSCIGYPCTTGLSQIDYRLSDAVCDPPGSEGHHVEKLVRLPDIFWCYRPPENCPDVVELPAEQKGGPITFGCANVFSKITPTALDLWGRILARVPNSRLLLQAAAFQMELPRKTVLNALRLHGLDESRVELIARQPMSEHLRTLGRFDIALDTFPFNGGTTTCHTLWMAAPVIALAGNRHASRMGASILTSLGLSELIAQTPDDYVEIATKLAMDHARLRALRRSIRERVRSSPLMDAPRFARAMEQAFQKMWAARSAM